MSLLVAAPSPAWGIAYDPGQGPDAIEFDGPAAPWQLQSSFEAFPAGNPVTNSSVLVAPGDNQFGFTSQTGGIPIVVANPTAHGGRAMCCANTGNGTNTSAAWGGNTNTSPFKGNFPTTFQPVYFRFYIYLTGLPATSIAAVMRLAYTSNNAGGSFQLQYLTTGVLRATYQNNANVAVSGWVPPTYTWVRVEGWTTVDPNFAQCQLSGYVGDSLTPIFSQTSAASFSQPPITAAFFGILGGSATTYTLFMDDIALGNVGLFGPSGTRTNSYDQELSSAVPPSFIISAPMPALNKPQVEYDQYTVPFAFKSTFEAFPLGSQINTGTSFVAPGDAPFTASAVNGGAPVAVSNPVAHGQIAMAANNPIPIAVGSSSVGWGILVASNGNNIGKGNLPVTNQPLYFRMYVYLNGPSQAASTALMRFAPVPNSGAGSFNLSYLTTGILRATYQNNNNVAIGSLVPPTYTWLRIEGWTTIDPNVAQCQLNIYLGDSLTPIISQTSAAAFSMPPVQQAFFGMLAGNANAPYPVIIDDIALGNTGLFGPSGTAVNDYDEPQFALTGPAWRNAFDPSGRLAVQGAQDAPFLVITASATAFLSLLATSFGEKVVTSSPVAAFVLTAQRAQFIASFNVSATPGIAWRAGAPFV